MAFRSNRWLPLAGLAALVVLNVILISLLLTRPSAPSVTEQSPPGAATPGPTEAHGETASPPAKQEPAELTEAEGNGALPPGERILVNADATSAWRATVGDCSTPGVLEYSTDQGETWQELPLELAPVSRMRVLGPQTLFAIGGGVDCEPTYLSSSTAGTSWLTNDQFLAGSWYLLPADRSVLATPVGEIEVPCETMEVAALDAVNAAVLCTDSTFALTQDGGASWSPAEVELGTRAIGVGTDGYALAGTAGVCGEALAVTVMDVAGVAEAEPTCTEAPLAAATEVAVSAIDGATWLWVDDQVFVSPNGSW